MAKYLLLLVFCISAHCADYVLYTAEGCAPCEVMKTRLKALNIKYVIGERNNRRWQGSETCRWSYFQRSSCGGCEMTATFVKKREGMRSDARLYELSAPLNGFKNVVVSAVVVPYSGAETYIFGADADGSILEWCEQEGSFRGGLDHVKALNDAGYEVIGG